MDLTGVQVENHPIQRVIGGPAMFGVSARSPDRLYRRRARSIPAAVFSLDDAFHNFLAERAGEIAGLACHDAQALVARNALLRALLPVYGQEKAGDALQLGNTSFLVANSVCEPFADQFALLNKVRADSRQVKRRGALNHTCSGTTAISASLAACSTASQPVATTGAIRIASTPWAMKDRKAAI
nr:hypothetical protein [Gemmobacter sp. 24YEA27]